MRTQDRNSLPSHNAGPAHDPSREGLRFRPPALIAGGVGATGQALAKCPGAEALLWIMTAMGRHATPRTPIPQQPAHRPTCGQYLALHSRLRTYSKSLGHTSTEMTG